jgi:hypothetical protein
MQHVDKSQLEKLLKNNPVIFLEKIRRMIGITYSRTIELSRKKQELSDVKFIDENALKELIDKEISLTQSILDNSFFLLRAKEKIIKTAKRNNLSTKNLKRLFNFFIDILPSIAQASDLLKKERENLLKPTKYKALYGAEDIILEEVSKIFHKYTNKRLAPAEAHKFVHKKTLLIGAISFAALTILLNTITPFIKEEKAAKSYVQQSEIITKTDLPPYQFAYFPFRTEIFSEISKPISMMSLTELFYAESIVETNLRRYVKIKTARGDLLVALDDTVFLEKLNYIHCEIKVKTSLLKSPGEPAIIQKKGMLPLVKQNVLAIIDKGDLFQVLARNKEWILVNTPKGKGFINLKNAKLERGDISYKQMIRSEFKQRQDYLDKIAAKVAQEQGIPYEILRSIRLTETRDKAIRRRYESKYYKKYIIKGKYGYAKNKMYQKLFQQLHKEGKIDNEETFKKQLATSVGNYQIIYSSAIDKGFEGSIEELEHPETNALWAAKIIRKAIEKGAKTPEQISEYYNTGKIGGKTHPGYKKRLEKNLKDSMRQTRPNTMASIRMPISNLYKNI